MEPQNRWGLRVAKCGRNTPTRAKMKTIFWSTRRGHRRQSFTQREQKRKKKQCKGGGGADTENFCETQARVKAAQKKGKKPEGFKKKSKGGKTPASIETKNKFKEPERRATKTHWGNGTGKLGAVKSCVMPAKKKKTSSGWKRFLVVGWVGETRGKSPNQTNKSSAERKTFSGKKKKNVHFGKQRGRGEAEKKMFNARTKKNGQSAGGWGAK